MKVKRNDLCPCGSGKKYKNCCLDDSEIKAKISTEEPTYEFEAGSYGGEGLFYSSIACHKITMDSSEYHFVLVNDKKTYTDENDAANEAIRDLDEAFLAYDKTGIDATVANVLQEKGYISMEDFNIIED